MSKYNNASSVFKLFARIQGVHLASRFTQGVVALVLVAFTIAGCSKSQESQSLQRAKRAAIDSVTAQVAAHTKDMMPRAMKNPVAGFYYPDFNYSVRSTNFGEKTKDGVRNAINVEFWGVANKIVFEKIQKSFSDAGYSVSRVHEGKDGKFTARFQIDGRPAVFVAVSGMGELNARRPGADGIAYFSWMSVK